MIASRTGSPRRSSRALVAIVVPIRISAGGNAPSPTPVSRRIASTAGTIKLGPGTLYRLLKQMAADGWIVETERDTEDPMRRRYYKLSAWGRRIAQAEAARLENLVRIARSRRLLPAVAL